jgi:hypothetical protein
MDINLNLIGMGLQLIGLGLAACRDIAKSKAERATGEIRETIYIDEGLAEFETAAAPQLLGAQTLGTLQISARTLGVSASIPPWLARHESSQGAANGF